MINTLYECFFSSNFKVKPYIELGEPMKILLSLSILISLYSNNLKISNNSSYCVMCINDQQVLDAYNQEYTQSVASISKVMTAILAIENRELEDKIKIDKIIYEAIGSSVYLKENEIYTLKDLLYGLMLRSGNDAALVIAKHVGGNLDLFVKMMNEKAKEIGMKSTVFKNPSGLDEIDGGNISNSCDMAFLMAYAMKNKTFREIVKTKSYTLNNGVVWINKNKFLFDYKYATGGKTGYTKLAKRTLITTSKKDNMEVVAVSLNINDDFNQHINMHEWAYNHYDIIQILKKGIYHYKNKIIHIDEDLFHSINKEKHDSIQIQTNLNENTLNISTSYKNNKTDRSYEVSYE